jgi:hypothetical protein
LEGCAHTKSSAKEGHKPKSTDQTSSVEEESAARVVTPVPSETSEAETSDSEAEAQDETSDNEVEDSKDETSENQVKCAKPSTHHGRKAMLAELLDRVSKLRISMQRNNEIPPDSQFANAIEELLPEDDEESVGSGQGQESALNFVAKAPLWVIFRTTKMGENVAGEEDAPGTMDEDDVEEDEETVVNAEEGFEKDEAATMKNPDEHKDQIAAVAKGLDQERIIEDAPALSHLVVQLVADESTADTDMAASGSYGSEEPKETFAECIDLVSLDSGEETKRQHMAARDSIEPIPEGVMTPALSRRQQQQLRRVSQSPTRTQTARRETSFSASTGASEGEGGEQEMEPDFENERSPVGRCERLTKDASKQTPTVKDGCNIRKPPFPPAMFQKIWDSAEDIIGCSMETIEHSAEFRSANNRLEKTVATDQNRAMYGRILPGAMDVSDSDVLLNCLCLIQFNSI